MFFAAGVGFNAPMATLEAVDRDAAIRVFRAAEALGGRRVIVICAYGTESGGPEGYKTGWWKHYCAAKHAAEQALMASTLPWTMWPQQGKPARAAAPARSRSTPRPA